MKRRVRIPAASTFTTTPTPTNMFFNPFTSRSQKSPRGTYAKTARDMRHRSAPDNDEQTCLAKGMMPFDIDGVTIYSYNEKRARQKKALMDALAKKANTK